VNLRQLQRGLEFERRQDGRQSLDEHRLAGAGRADEQDIMRACARHFERALDGVLAAHLPEVNVVVAVGREQLLLVHADGTGARACVRAQSRDHLDRAAQGRDGVDLDAADDRRLSRVLFREDEARDARVARAQRDGERAAYGSHATVERKLADREHVGQALGLSEVAACAEYAERNGEVEARSLFAHVGGREVDGRLVEGEEECAVVDGGADALARLSHGEVGQADDGDGRGRVCLAARRAKVNLDVHEVCVYAVDCGGLRAEEHGREALPLAAATCAPLEGRVGGSASAEILAGSDCAELLKLKRTSAPSDLKAEGALACVVRPRPNHEGRARRPVS
jgi:hypothetical protein